MKLSLGGTADTQYFVVEIARLASSMVRGKTKNSTCRSFFNVESMSTKSLAEVLDGLSCKCSNENRKLVSTKRRNLIGDAEVD